MLFDTKQIKVAKNVKELINRRRLQVLVHSYIYYKMNTNLIEDHTFDKWCRELVQLHIKYPTESKSCMFQKAFQGWNGFSGYDLFSKDTHAEQWASNKAKQLMSSSL